MFVQHQHDASFWALPGGKLDDGETLTDGLRREIVEELGVDPAIGKLLYVHQLFMHGTESLEFFFEVTNGQDYAAADIQKTTHGQIELVRAAFIDPQKNFILPEFLSALNQDREAADWPKVLVRADTRI